MLKLRRSLSLLPLVVVAAAFGPASGASAQAAQISWTACPLEDFPTLQCGTFEVPYDYSRPTGKKFTLALQKLPASGTKTGTLFTNPGGPGEPGRTSWTIPANSQSLRGSFDLVGFDPRGIGETRPALDCDTPGAVGPPNTPNVNWARLSAQQARITGAANRACQRKSAGFIAHVGTNNVVRDLDAMRAAVGDSKLTFWGMSYGTTIGSVYAYRYPRRVRAILLDGTVAPNLTWASYQEWGTDRAVDETLRFIRAVSPASYAAVISTRNSLFASPVDIGTAGNSIKVDAYDWLFRIAYPLVNAQSNWPQIVPAAKLVSQARIVGSGGDQARASLRTFLSAEPEGAGGKGGGGNYAINCLDYAGHPGARQRSQIVRNVVSRAPVFRGLMVIANVNACVGFSFRPDPIPRLASRASLARVRNLKLAISNSSADPATPLAWGRVMVRTFPSAFAVTQLGGNHVNFLRTESDCVDNPLREYLLTRKMAPRRTTCLFTAPAGLDMSAVAASKRKLDPSAIVETILRNNRLNGR